MTNQFLDFLIAKKLGKQPLTPHNLSFSLIPYLNAVQRGNDAEATGYVFYQLLEQFGRDLPTTLKALTEVQAQYQIENQQRFQNRRNSNNLWGDSASSDNSPKTLTTAFCYGTDEPDPLRAHYKNVPNKKRD